MKHIFQNLILIMFIAMSLTTAKLNARAAVVPNVSGESYEGYVYPYKYWDGTKWQWGSRTSWSKDAVPITYQFSKVIKYFSSLVNMITPPL